MRSRTSNFDAEGGLLTHGTEKLVNTSSLKPLLVTFTQGGLLVWGLYLHMHFFLSLQGPSQSTLFTDR
jgi:hypothetical protein